MERLLFLAHRIPYPPNKGDKIRSWHLLAGLAGRYRVDLGAFVDDPDDWSHRGVLEDVCDHVRLVGLRPPLAKLRAIATGMSTGRALSLPYFHHPGLRRWVRDRLRDPAVTKVVVYSSAMAQYLGVGPKGASYRTVVDFVDVDSDKWSQYADSKAWPASAVYRREADRLARFERAVARSVDASVFVSEAEAGFFRESVPDVAARVHAVENGVDTEYFAPERSYPDPYGGGGPVAVFTGAMDYWANADAVTWFADEVLPEVRRRIPDARFYVVGSRPTEAVRGLGTRPGVTVTGTVPDVRPFLRHAGVAVAPLRIARGIQNKVLEAMAMARPVIASPAAMDGLDVPSSGRPLVAESTESWIEAVEAALEGEPRGSDGASLRRSVVERFAWPAKVDRFVALLDGP